MANASFVFALLSAEEQGSLCPRAAPLARVHPMERRFLTAFQIHPLIPQVTGKREAGADSLQLFPRCISSVCSRGRALSQLSFISLFWLLPRGGVSW